MANRGIVGAIEAAFDRYDSDGSGAMDKYELGNLTKALGATLTGVQLEAALKLLDRDHSGTVDKEEFVNWWLSRGADLDADGKVSELEAQLNKVALAGSNEAIREHIEKIREDRDALNREMLMLDDDRARIQKLKVSMEERLARVNEDLTYKKKARQDVEMILRETESAYESIVQSQRSLLTAVQHHIPHTFAHGGGGGAGAGGR